VRNTEKILLGVLVLVLALVLMNAIDNIWLLIPIYITVLIYAVGGYWLFRSKEAFSVIPILAGLAFGTAILTLPWGIRSLMDPYKAIILAVPNVFLFLFLIFYSYRLKYKNWLGDNLKLMLIRSGVLLVLTAIIATSSINTWAHRQFLRPLNQQNESLLHNFDMFDFADRAEEELTAGRCETAISAANASRKAGERWLNWQEGDSLKELKSIAGVLDLQYKAYLCKGQAAWQADNYKLALANYQYVDKVLDELIAIDSSNVSSRVWSWERMAECYAQLHDYEVSDSLYALAIKLYVKQGWEYNENLAELIVALGANQIAQGTTDDYYQAMQPFIVGFENIYKERGEEKGIMVLYKNVIQNALRAKDLEHAELYLKKALEIIGTKESLDSYKLQYYKGYLAVFEDNYQEAVEYFEKVKKGYEKLESPTSLNHVAIRKALFNTYMALADFSNAERYLNDALSISEKLAGRNSLNYHQVLKDAALLDEQLGNYEAAKEKLEQVYKVYERIWGKNNKVMEVGVHLASIELELDNQDQARFHIESLEGVINEYPDFIDMLDTETMLQWANVRLELEDFKAAASIYKTVVDKMDEKLTQLQKAKVHTGIAIINIEQGNYKEADMLLMQANVTAQNAFGKSHPFIATLHYNKSSLLMHQENLTEARKEMERAIAITEIYYTPKHPTHADNEVMLGDIYLGDGELKAAEKSYRKAEGIYRLKYKPEHRKRKSVEDRIGFLKSKPNNQKVI
jgi:hypothetical protein